MNQNFTILDTKLKSGADIAADKLATARTINGTAFDGTSNVVTANWGTTRSFSITDGTNTGSVVSVNGSGNVSLKLPTIIRDADLQYDVGKISPDFSSTANVAISATNSGVVYDTNIHRTLCGHNIYAGTITGKITGRSIIYESGYAIYIIRLQYLDESGNYIQIATSEGNTLSSIPTMDINSNIPANVDLYIAANFPYQVTSNLTTNSTTLNVIKTPVYWYLI